MGTSGDWVILAIPPELKMFIHYFDFIFNYLFALFTGRSAPIYKVLSIDYSSALEMLNKEYEKMTFDDLDLKNDLKVSFVLISELAQYNRENYVNNVLI